MSQVQLPDVQAADANLFQGLHNQVFFQKLAAAGHSVGGSEYRARAMLDLAGKLEALETTELQKAGTDLGDPYCAANAALDQLLASQGLDGQIKSAQGIEADHSLNAAVGQLMQDPTLYNSALSLKVAEAEHITQWLAQQQPVGPAA